MNREFQIKIKRIFDILFSLFIIVPFFPIWLIVGILIKTTSKGPIFFFQDRPGLKGKIFKIYKFRTMKPGSDKTEKGKEVMLDDDRITSIGKVLRRTKVDEIPQVINVLKGDMSLVGPRPERIDSLQDYDEEIWKRLDMRPGMTGLAQVSGNIHISLKERYKLDVKYVETFSLILDIIILIKTVGVVVLGEEKFKRS
ncbi:sugar transferase [Macrococcus epidermidis]|uniref:sugar transferase n=1 Tax=Macrococcus epidermidis TaxID=1902580 RepID=UPI001EF3572D|nr:sugar transferase [Macrococcus epidermidis]MCG7421123.1 sugar transferase [Macrococcus epidermidis]